MRHQGPVGSVAFSPDGTRIITGISNWAHGMVRLWDANTGAAIGEVMKHNHVSSLAVSPDGTCVVAGGWDAARLWDVTISDINPRSTSRTHEILQLWTGFDADSDGTLHGLTPDQLDDIRRQVVDNDPLRRFVTDRWRRRAETYDRRAAAEAEGAGRWSAAVYRLEKMIKKSPADSAIQARLTFAIAKLAQANGDLDRALKGIDEAIRLDSGNAMFYMSRGDIRSRDDDQREAAMTDYRSAVRLNLRAAKKWNDEAWRWATSPDERARNGMLAVVAATQACELTGWKSFMFIDTLAAACAEDNDFENAVKWQTRALELAPEPNQPDLAVRLELYKSGMPYRQ